ncbi:MAG: MBL fold metallo-hydrolase [Myxococcaceae bacterium]|nr:MBL fold metallo-hydrolase [Myxococcaceae bacterium]
MHVTWLGHAALFVNVANRSVLIDPWFAEPVFAGAWFRYPPTPYPDPSTMPKPDFVCLSHTHDDHAGLETLKQLRSDQRVLAVDFPSGAMRRRLAAAGLANVDWFAPWQTKEVSPGLEVTFVPHDAGWEVASPVVSGEGVTLYHGNDNTLSTDAYAEVARRLGPIDVAFLPYAGASSYPTRFDGDAETRRRRCREKKDEGLQRFLDGIEGLRPSEAAPFASSWALLELAEVDTNFEDRLTAPEVLARAMQFAHERDAHLLHLEPGDEWSPETGALNRGLVSQHPLTAAGVRRYAELERSRVVRVQQGLRGAVEVSSLDALVRDFFSTAWLTSHAPSSVDGVFGLESGETSWTLRCAGDRADVEPGLAADVSEILRLPPGELSKVLTGEWSWEDVWYGYRLHVTKRVDAGYARAFWERLLGIEADLVRARSRGR